MQPKYKRILLKLSGESLAGENKHGIDFDVVQKICEPIKKCVEAGVQVAVVVGGGNFWRGRSSGEMDRTRADHMGMLATTINALGVADALEALGVEVRVQTAISMRQVAEPSMVDGVYDSDPKKNPDAKKFETITHQEVLNKGLAVMDSTASALCKDNDLPILVFSIDDPENIYRAVCGENIGTVVKNEI